MPAQPPNARALFASSLSGIRQQADGKSLGGFAKATLSARAGWALFPRVRVGLYAGQAIAQVIPRYPKRARGG